RHHVGPVSIGHVGSREPGVGLRHSDGDAWQHGVTLIGHSAAQPRGRQLRRGDGAGYQETNYAQREIPEQTLHSFLLKLPHFWSAPTLSPFLRFAGYLAAPSATLGTERVGHSLLRAGLPPARRFPFLADRMLTVIHPGPPSSANVFPLLHAPARTRLPPPGDSRGRRPGSCNGDLTGIYKYL